jgi:ABC-type branched-subunit amino acid transport system substrate-binding protein
MNYNLTIILLYVEIRFSGTAGPMDGRPEIRPLVWNLLPMKRYDPVDMFCRRGLWILALVLILSAFAGCRGPVSPLFPQIPAEDRQYTAAEALFESGEYDGAMAGYQAYVSRYPHRPPAADALMKMAFIHVVYGQHEEARQLYQRVIDDYPESSSAENARVEILATYYHLGDFTGFFDRLRGLDTASLSAAARLRLYKLEGDAYLSSGEAKTAVMAYSRSLLSYPEDQRPEITDELKTAMGVLDLAEIEELLAGPDYLPKAYLLYQLGLSNLVAGWDQPAADAFNRFLASYPDHELSETAREYLQEIQQRAAYGRYAIGCLLPLSGAYSSYGNRALNGVELALDRFRRNYPDVPIELVVKDSGSSEAQAVAAVQELEAARVSAILGPIAMAIPAAEEAQRLGIPIITLSQKEGISDIGEYVFRNFLTPQNQVRTTVSYLTDVLGLKRFAILYPDEKYGATFMNAFWDEVIAHGGVVTGCESYQGEATDFADPIKKLVGLYYEMPESLKTELESAARPLPADVWRRLHPDVFQDGYARRRPWIREEMSDAGPGGKTRVNVFMLGEDSEELLTGEGDYRRQEDEEFHADVDFDALFIPDSPKKTGLIVPRLAYFDVDDVYFVGTNLWHSDELIQMARRYLQNSLLTDGFYVESKLPAVRQFVEDYEAIFGAEPGFIEAVAYDTAGILFETVSRPDVLSRTAIRETLMASTAFRGVTGTTSFLESGEADKILFLLQIKGSGFRVVEQE